MTAADDASTRDPLDLLSEEFLRRHRAGEAVTVDGFCRQHPAHAAELKDLLETLLALESVKRDRATSGSGGRVALPALDRLGDFRIERELGRGGMGVVFEAVQESLDRRVALKVLPQASLLTGNQLQRFRREAQIAARLHHTNIVPVYGSGESDGYHWYAMQFIAGQSLDQWRAQQRGHAPVGAGPWRSRARFVARLGAAAASALHAAHGYGTLHRDIKPANFLLDQEDHLWITDFGLAKALEGEGLTKSGDVLGTLQYMAPEQFAGHYDVRSEVYALGVTLYELLTLEPAFRGRNRSELIERVQAQRLEPAAAAKDAPRDLLVIIGKAMAREPRDRYRDAHELQSDLEAFLEDRPIRARRLSALATTWRWCRRNRAVAALSASALLAVLLASAAGWVAYVGINREHDRAENNLRLSLTAFGDVFDALVGRDPLLAYESDPDSGEQAVVVEAPVSPRDVTLLQKMLAFYDQFASENADSESLRYDTARAYRRVGAIHARLGEPESLQAAELAFEQARQRLAGIDGRDVRRDLAQVHVDLGLLHERTRRIESASEHLQQALELYEALPNAAAPANRLERAKVLFQLARLHRRGSGGRGRGGDEDLQRALALVQQLLVDDGDDPEVLALKARCLREDLRGHSPEEMHASMLEATSILRELAAAHPERPEYRFEFSETALAAADGPGRRLRAGRPEREADRDARAAEELQLLREADAAAFSLFEDQPYFREYRALLGRVRSALGLALHRQGVRAEGAARLALLEEAEVALRAALDASRDLVRPDQPTDPRHLRQVVETHTALGSLCEAQQRREDAKQHALAALELVAGQIARRPGGDAEEPPRPPERRWPPDRDGPPPERPPFDEPRDSPRDGPRRGPDGRRSRDRRGLGSLQELIDRIGDDELTKRRDELLDEVRGLFEGRRRRR